MTVMDGGQIAQGETRLFDEWEARHGVRLWRDGAVVATEYATQDPRILFVLKEANVSPDEQPTHLSKFLEQGGRAATWNNVARWACGILSGLPDEGALGQLWQRPDGDFRRNWLCKIAVVNVNKIGGGGSADHVRLLDLVEKNGFGGLLARQVHLLNPQVIICGGAWVPDVLGNASPLLVAGTWNQVSGGRATASAQVGKTNGPVVVEMPHPGARMRAAELYEALRSALRLAGFVPPTGATSI